MTDYLSALRKYLLAQADVDSLCEGRVFVLALPAEQISRIGVGNKQETLMPRKCVVVAAAGGDDNPGLLPIGRARIQVVCYAESDFEAARMERPVAEALKTLNRETIDGVLLHNATVSGGPSQGRDPETFWPAMLRTAVVRYDEREVV
jgi:hypothetical protein